MGPSPALPIAGQILLHLLLLGAIVPPHPDLLTSSCCILRTSVEAGAPKGLAQSLWDCRAWAGWMWAEVTGAVCARGQCVMGICWLG